MKKLLNYIPKFRDQKILVIGDLMVDRFIWGKVSRISPEAPVPVVETTKETTAFGGAGNVLNNIISLGAKVYSVGVVGDDITGDKFLIDLKAQKVNLEGIVKDNARPTIIKTRIIASHQQVVRVDKEIKGNFSSKIINELISRIEEIAPTVNAIIISDYGKGVISIPVLKKAINLAQKYSIPITVDPKIEHFLQYKSVTCITPNLLEAITGMKILEATTDKEVKSLGKKILKALNSKSVLITRGEKGMTLVEPKKITHIPTRAKEVYDVTGAGDTVISTLTLALASKASFVEAAELSNFAAGIVVGKIGTATVTPKEIKDVISGFRK